MAKFNEYTKQIDLSEEEKTLFKEAGADVGIGKRQAFKRNHPNLSQALDDNFVGWEIKEPTGFMNIHGKKLIDDFKQDPQESNNPLMGQDYWGDKK